MNRNSVCVLNNGNEHVCVLNNSNEPKQCPVADLEGGVRGVRPPKIRKAYVIQR